MKLFGIFGSTMSKCQDIIGKYISLPPHSLFSSPSNKLIVFDSFQWTPCMTKKFLLLEKAFSHSYCFLLVKKTNKQKMEMVSDPHPPMNFFYPSLVPAKALNFFDDLFAYLTLHIFRFVTNSMFWHFLQLQLCKTKLFSSFWFMQCLCLSVNFQRMKNKISNQ